MDITISGGAINIDSSDDAIHSNGSLTVGGDDILIASGDDGLHSDLILTVNGGKVTITRSYEGLESMIIAIHGGTLRIVSDDDGINGVGGVDGSAINGRPGQNPFGGSGDSRLDISGGYVAIDALGDGIDVNGPIAMTGGTVLINGPTENFNGALDYAGSFEIGGGLLVAVGSVGMAMSPGASSTQYTVAYNFASPQAAGTIFHVETQDGQDILTFAPSPTNRSCCLCRR